MSQLGHEQAQEQHEWSLILDDVDDDEKETSFAAVSGCVLPWSAHIYI